MVEVKNDFLRGKLFPMILKYSIPAAISLLITAIYNIVDRIFVGNFNGTSALAGLSICFPLSYMMMAFGLTCSAGGASLFSLFAGKNQQRDMNRSFGNALILVVVSEIALTIVLLIFTDPLLQIFGVTETAYPYAYEYYRIVALGCLFQGLTQVFCDFVRVSGKPVLGMCVTGIGAVTNIILDAVFVAVMGWGVAGAAWATVIGQCLSALFGAYLVLKGYTKVEVKKETFRLDFGLSQKIISCGFAFWISQMAMGLISLVYNSQLGKYGRRYCHQCIRRGGQYHDICHHACQRHQPGIQPLWATISVRGIIRGLWLPCIRLPGLSVGVTCLIWLVVLLFPGKFCWLSAPRRKCWRLASPGCGSISALRPFWDLSCW